LKYIPLQNNKNEYKKNKKMIMLKRRKKIKKIKIKKENNM